MIKSKLQTITPTIAKQMLKQNTGNRKPSKGRVAFYAEEILKGRWKVNGDSIRFNGSRIIDGQHRLLAVVAAKKSIKCLVTTGLKSDVFGTIDRGLNRTAGQILKMAGESGGANLAASIGVCINYTQYNGTLHFASSAVSPSAVQEFLNENPRIRDLTKWGVALRKVSLVNISALIAARFLFEKSNRKLSDTFFEKFLTGRNIGKTDPVGALRQSLIQYKNTGVRLRALESVGHLIVAWNFVVAGRRCTASVIKMPKDGKLPRIKRKR